MRILLFTGKGGVGKSTVAAATAATCAAQASRTLMISTDAAHSLSDVLDAPIGPGAGEVGPDLWVHQVDAQLGFEDSWTAIQRYLRAVAQAIGIDDIVAEELTVIPGAEEVLALLALRDHALAGGWDVIVVDCAPTAETLRLLALPDALGWYLERLMPMHRRLVGALGGWASRNTGVPAPDDGIFAALRLLHEQLVDVREILTEESTSVRIVLTPDSVVLAEARRCYTSLCLYGYRVDAVVANRIFPPGDADPWRARWVETQNRVLAEAEESFAGLALLRVEYAGSEPTGQAALAALGERVYTEVDAGPTAVFSHEPPLHVDSETGAEPSISLKLPFLSSARVTLARHGGDLVVTLRPDTGVGGGGSTTRRVISLPTSLAACEVTGAKVADGWLRVRFTRLPQAANGGASHGVRHDSPVGETT